jgi:hypothetical protein
VLEAKCFFPPGVPGALEQLTDKEGSPVGVPHVEDRDDIGMVESGGDLCLARKPPETILILGEALGQQLDRHVTAEPGVACSEDLTHASRSQRGAHLVRTQAGPG